jgi:S-adenosyl-L-methionine hydrolase (adenosine-forming)
VLGWVTFLSDYGLDDAFVGICHGVIANIAPGVRVIDVCHNVAPQDVSHGATTLAEAVPYLPKAVHLAIVDPGVGTERRAVAVESASGSIFVGPDNGLHSLALDALGGAVRAHELSNRDLFLPNPGKTFHGRDIFAPVAAHLADGADLADVGREVDVAGLQRMTLREATVDDDHVHAEIRSVDHFGNLSLNCHRSDLEAAGMQLGDTVELRMEGRTLQVPFTLTFAEVAPGRVAVCEDSTHHITVAVNTGHAARTLRSRRGDPVVISRMARTPTRSAERIGVLSPPPATSTV